MTQHISATQQGILHEAVDTLDAEFIAQCVVNIEGILVYIKKLIRLSTDSHQPAFPLTTEQSEPVIDSGERRAQHFADAADVAIKEEPTLTIAWPVDPPSFSPVSHDSKAKHSANQSKGSKSRVVFTEPLRCALCSYITHRGYRLDDHVRRKHKVTITNGPREHPLLKSDVTNRAFSRRRRKNSQTNQVVDPPSVACVPPPPLAFVPLTTPTVVNDVATDPYHRCEMCSHQATSLEKLAKHISSEHSTVYISDIRSETVTARRTRQTRRRGQGHRVSSLSCSSNQCTYIADSKANLTRHMTAEHPKLSQPIRCEHCDFTTMKRANYRQHVKIHLAPEDKPYKCTLCTSYSSANKEGLRIHVNSTHKGVKPYLCDTCGQSFTGISMLSKHKLMKHKPKHLQCEFCDYKTSLQTWLKDHMRKHSSDTPFICQFCSYAAKTAGRLKVHLRIHTGERPYKCHMCDYGAMEGAPLKKHMKNQHQLSVHRIDIREGKLIMSNGEVIQTGKGTKTAPLPPGSFHGNKERTGAHDPEETVVPLTVIDIPVQGEDLLSGSAGEPTSIIAQAATLSALPVHPESPTSEVHESEQTNYTELMTVEPQYVIPATSVANIISHSINIADTVEVQPTVVHKEISDT